MMVMNFSMKTIPDFDHFPRQNGLIAELLADEERFSEVPERGVIVTIKWLACCFQRPT